MPMLHFLPPPQTPIFLGWYKNVIMYVTFLTPRGGVWGAKRVVMLRLIVGWIRHDGEDWSDTMSRMNRRMAFAMTIWECKPWSWQIFRKQFRVATKIFDQPNSWAAATSTWTPTNEWQQIFSTEPKRRQGRPSKRWDDNLEKFAMNYFRMSWGTAARIRPEWQFFEQVYVQFCSSMWPMNPPNPCRIKATRTGERTNERVIDALKTVAAWWSFCLALKRTFCLCSTPRTEIID